MASVDSPSTGIALQDSTASAGPARPSKETAPSCECNPSSESSGDLEKNNIVPTQEILKKCERITILDKDGNSVQFKDLYTSSINYGKVLIVFIRHFFCGNCQEYLRTLINTFDSTLMALIPHPLDIVIIGHGDPSLIASYSETTLCPYPIYTDPTKALFNELGMARTLDMGTKPEYQKQGTITAIFTSAWQLIRLMPKGLGWTKGGDFWQVGGDFIFAKGKGGEPIVEWCHRMRNTRDHVEMSVLKKALCIKGDEDVKV